MQAKMCMSLSSDSQVLGSKLPTTSLTPLGLQEQEQPSWQVWLATSDDGSQSQLLERRQGCSWTAFNCWEMVQQLQQRGEIGQ